MAKKKATTRKKKTTKKKAPAGTANSSFMDALDGLDDAWQESRAKPPSRGGGGANENVPDDDYIARVSSATVGQPRGKIKDETTGEERNKPPYFKMSYTILAGECENERITSYDEISNREVGDSGRTQLDILSARLQCCGVDISKMSLKELPQLAQHLSKEGPVVRITVKNDYVSAENARDGKDHHYQNTYVNDFVPAEEVDNILAQFK